jgi:uridine kinase
MQERRNKDVSHPPNYIIAVSSVSGGGKTTLVKRTADLLGGTVLFFDDYASVSQYPPDIKKWLEDGADVNEWHTPQFARDLTALRRGDSIVSPKDGTRIGPSEFIVIEEPMGRQRLEMATLIDFVAVVDTPMEIALARRLLRDLGSVSLAEIEKAAKKQSMEGCVQTVTYLKEYLSGYLDALRGVYIAVQERAKENCDLVLDGTLPVDELSRQLVTAVEDKPRTGNTW